MKEQEVLQLQEKAKKFIMQENLEAWIETLDCLKSYNWASPEKVSWSGTEHRRF